MGNGGPVTDGTVGSRLLIVTVLFSLPFRGGLGKGELSDCVIGDE